MYSALNLSRGLTFIFISFLFYAKETAVPFRPPEADGELFLFFRNCETKFLLNLLLNRLNVHTDVADFLF